MNPGVSCRNCELAIEAGNEEELQEPCREGRCTAPVEEGGLGVVVLHPVNALVVAFYERCRQLTPVVALATSDLSWHPDRDLMGRQLEVLVRGCGPLTELPKQES